MWRSLTFFTLACTLAAVAPAHAQVESRQLRGNGPIGPLGFRYGGTPDLSVRPPRWADYPVVMHVFQNSPALAAGLREGDVILKVNGRDGCEATAYHAHAPGTPYTLVVQRGREQKVISFVLVEPAWPDSAWAPPASRR